MDNKVKNKYGDIALVSVCVWNKEDKKWVWRSDCLAVEQISKIFHCGHVAVGRWIRGDNCGGHKLDAIFYDNKWLVDWSDLVDFIERVSDVHKMNGYAERLNTYNRIIETNRKLREEPAYD